ncbi:hypothetical protein IFT48_18575 [Pseudomonas fluorescens]|uniref:hypothetical protein n=1 Tax=Pseudomonas fluorescens TaxID=294 RepID=UPI001902DD0B|nr:hypothetical protein [Pseudomonas fluorescens]MBD8092003.1 hypothetical protein [Pseudomonas fluorescens]MBD8718240.1 hypothetical protein [Pseudomonas fluorescens]
MAAILAQIQPVAVRNQLKVYINSALAAASLAPYSAALVNLSNYIVSCTALHGLSPHAVQYIEDYVTYSWKNWRLLFVPIP